MNLPHRVSPRRKDYDYGSPWGYFITICTKDRERYFGEIIDWIMNLSPIWEICTQEIIDTNLRRKYVEVDEYIVMPNHIHLLLFINTIPAVGTCSNTSDIIKSDLPVEHNNWSTESDTLPCVPTTNHKTSDITSNQTLWSIIRNIKSRVTKYAYQNDIPFARQSRYHDRVIRNQLEYDKIKYYIQTNPQNRESDTFNI
jgi:REP element-mobilizing transposase RayT